jgi:hypothetical protein
MQMNFSLGESGAQSRLEVTVTTGLTPLVGREGEVGCCWSPGRRAQRGRARW